MALDIRPDNLEGEAIRALLGRHLAHSAASSPAESCHALDLEGLRETGVTFWSAYDGERLVGCGALMELDAATGEIKSMHTLEEVRGRGVASALLRHIIATAEARGYEALLLETGSMEAYAPARALYARHGFRECPPFGDYVEDPHSTFMKLDLASRSS